MSELSRETQTWGGPRSASFLLLGASLVVLWVGGFIQFDDTSGFGSERWSLPWGFVAGLLVLASVAVAVSDRAARRTLGAALGTLDVFLICASVTDEGFRFIWSGDQGELFFLQVALGLAALILLTPTFMSPKEPSDGSRGRTPSPWFRVGLYAAVSVIAMFAAFSAGISHFESTNCDGPGFDGECDLAALEGFAWTGGTFVLLVIAFGVAEWLRASRLRRQHQDQV